MSAIGNLTTTCWMEKRQEEAVPELGEAGKGFLRVLGLLATGRKLFPIVPGLASAQPGSKL